MTTDATVVLENYTYFECPRWHDGRIWVSDFYTHQVISAQADGSDVRVEAEVPQQPSGLGWLPDGRLLIVSMRDHTILRREDDGSLAVHADLSHLVEHHLNDMLVDGNGRAYVGNFGFDLMNGGDPASTSLILVEPDGSSRVVADGLWFPNGMALTSDGRLVVDETVANRISVFDIHDDGGLGERRDWAVFGELPDMADTATAMGQIVLAPDGCAIDGDDVLWVADALNGRIARVVEGEGITDQLDFDSGVFACGFGGEDGHTLFVCAAPDFDEHARKEATDGRLLSVAFR
ncbi:SMP-30/gluconolactonase/LRE family protein [Williamsia deligens]|uniref:SMP-30/gluconolactonase/LRE family protein n=1 Tax=Williamsia deligens TaxID=321325 RepID=A0ABW3G5N6_9NOCA|nr:SMP-30/gluconolactonase/LRE family protein [Williamsia deligens]MCP2193892.1 Sugar lactone lactonase YvrE [Williamsia deligens]